MHYTLLSGIRTQTITSRCPVCLKVTYYNTTTNLTDETVCCISCKDQYIPKLWELWHRAQLWGQEHNKIENATDIFNAYMIEVGV